MDNFKTFHQGVSRLHKPLQLILGLDSLILVLGMVILLNAVAINPGALGSVIALLNAIVGVVTFLLIIGGAITLLNSMVIAIVFLLGKDNRSNEEGDDF